PAAREGMADRCRSRGLLGRRHHSRTRIRLRAAITGLLCRPEVLGQSCPPFRLVLTLTLAPIIPVASLSTNPTLFRNVQSMPADAARHAERRQKPMAEEPGQTVTASFRRRSSTRCACLTSAGSLTRIRAYIGAAMKMVVAA